MEETSFVTQEVWTEEETGRRYLVVLYWELYEGRYEVHGVELRSIRRPSEWGEEDYESLLRTPIDEPVQPAPVTSATLRHLPLRKVANRHLADARRMTSIVVRRGGLDTQRKERERRLRELEGMKTRGRRGLGSSYYAEVAEVYDRARFEGRRDPARAVAEWLGGEPVAYLKGGMSNYATASKHVARARKLGLIRDEKGADQ